MVCPVTLRVKIGLTISGHKSNVLLVSKTHHKRREKIMTAAQAFGTGAFDVLIRGNMLHKQDRILAVKMVRELTNSDLRTTLDALNDRIDALGLPRLAV
jgi:hypothetical protein